MPWVLGRGRNPQKDQIWGPATDITAFRKFQIKAFRTVLHTDILRQTLEEHLFPHQFDLSFRMDADRLGSPQIYRNQDYSILTEQPQKHKAPEPRVPTRLPPRAQSQSWRIQNQPITSLGPQSSEVILPQCLQTTQPLPTVLCPWRLKRQTGIQDETAKLKRALQTCGLGSLAVRKGACHSILLCLRVF